MLERIGMYFTVLIVCLMPLPGVLTLHVMLRTVTKRGTPRFLHVADKLACPLAVLLWFLMGDAGKSLGNLVEMFYPCWLWNAFILMRSVLNLKDTKLDERTWAIVGCVALNVVVVLAHIFTPCLPE